MPQAVDTLPDDPETLKAMLIAERVRSRAARARSSRNCSAIASAAAPRRFPKINCCSRSKRSNRPRRARRRRLRKNRPAERAAAAKKRRANRGALPPHLPRIETIVDIEDKACPCCNGELHRIGEDVSERLDIMPAQFRVLVVRRPKYACRACEDVVVQSPAPARLIEGGMPTEATVAHVLVSKYADHLPLYRQAQIYERQGIRPRPLDARRLGRPRRIPLAPHPRAHSRPSPVVDEALRRRDDGAGARPGARAHEDGSTLGLRARRRPWGGSDPPAVAYVYAPDRKAEQPIAHLAGFNGVLQVDGYAGYRALAEKGDVQLAFCWTHVRRRFYELAVGGPAPIASEALERIAALYAIEKEIRGRSAEERRAVRQDEPGRCSPISSLAARKARADQPEDQARRGDPLHALALGRPDALRRRRPHRNRLQHCRAIDPTDRPQSQECALRRLRRRRRKLGDHRLADRDLQALGVDPQAYLADALTKIVNGHLNSQIDDLLPWAYAQREPLTEVA